MTTASLKPPRYDLERAHAMWQDWTAGKPMRVIAPAYGVTPQRVSQILQRYRRDMVLCWWCGEPRRSSKDRHSSVR